MFRRNTRAQAAKRGANRIDHDDVPKPPLQPRHRIASVTAADIDNDRVQIVRPQFGKIPVIHVGIERAHGIRHRRAFMEACAADIAVEFDAEVPP